MQATNETHVKGLHRNIKSSSIKTLNQVRISKCTQTSTDLVGHQQPKQSSNCRDGVAASTRLAQSMKPYQIPRPSDWNGILEAGQERWHTERLVMPRDEFLQP